MYIDKKDALEIISRMQNFEMSLKMLFSQFDYDLHENLGRRNMLLSNAQEKETAKVLRKKFKEVESDGSPGKPDVVIHDINKELECKLTSGSHSNGNTTYNLQTDWATLTNKEVLDYNYIIANDDFTEFCYILFEGLTVDDFFPPAKSSRGKSRMNKAKAMKKAKFIVGDLIDNSSAHIKDIDDEIQQRTNDFVERIKVLEAEIKSATTEIKKNKRQEVLNNTVARYEKAINKLKARRQYWEENDSFSFSFEKIESPKKSKVSIKRNKNVLMEMFSSIIDHLFSKKMKEASNEG